MNKISILLYATAFLITATAATGIPVQRRLKRSRAKRFKVICESWLKDVNLAADDPSCSTGGSAFFSPAGGVYERRCGDGWLVRYPITRSYPDLGLTTRIDLLVHVYSLVPDANGTIDTIFVALAEPVPHWWDTQQRMTAFPKVTFTLYASNGSERKFSYASAFSNTLIPAQ
ncbi:TPA: hypothetical protein DEB29_01955 [Candidatus Wolfebacteria bacterium]|nr:hypothetical protein [Candidatus Wolfebacteria bacterium]